MKTAVNLTEYAKLEKPPISLQLASDRNKKKPYQAVIIPSKIDTTGMDSLDKRWVRDSKPRLKKWIFGYKIVKDCGDHMEEVNPCHLIKTDKEKADIMFEYYKHKWYYRLPEKHRFLKVK